MSAPASILGLPHNADGPLQIERTASCSKSPRILRDMLYYPSLDEGFPRPSSPSRSTRTLPDDDIDIVLPIAPCDVWPLTYHGFEYYSMSHGDAEIPHIKPYQFDYEREHIPSDWRACVCPEGTLYFAHKEKRVVTLTNILESKNYTRIMAAIDCLEPRFPSNSSDIELLVQRVRADGVPAIGYYFAHWEKHIVFWSEQVQCTLVTNGEWPPVSAPHLQLAVHSQFGLHVEMFCAHRDVPLSMVEEVKDSYESGIVDVITSDQPMFSYDADTTERFVRILERVSKQATVNRHTSWIVGRFYKTLYSNRYLAVYGESCSSRDGSAFKDAGRSPRTLFFFLVSPFLFFMPFVYLKELDGTYVGRTLHYQAWGQFFVMLKKDWDNAITPATVLLSANIGFLAIQSIDETGISGNRSAAQIASYISATLSLFVYIVCQILNRRHRHHEAGTGGLALKFLESRQQRFLGLQGVAMAFSLPIALFMWSMISFLAAMIFVFFDKTNVTTKITLGAILTILLIVIMALLYLEWGNSASMGGFDLFWAELIKLPSEWLKRHVQGEEEVYEATSIHIDVEMGSMEDDSERENISLRHSENLRGLAGSLSGLAEKWKWMFRRWVLRRGRKASGEAHGRDIPATHTRAPDGAEGDA